MKKNTLITKIPGFLKKNIFSVSCLLFSLLILLFGSISYSKYIIGTSEGSSSSTASFSVSGSIDGISGLSFTNTTFWSSSDENDKIAMNVLRNLNFSVSNFKTLENGNKKVSDVKLHYNLCFSTPSNFASKLAIQVFDSNKDPLLPQIVIEDLLNASTTTGIYKTVDSIDYNEEGTKELEFEVIKHSDSLYSATSGNIIITIEEFEKEINQALLFRMWDTSTLTNELNPKLETEGGKVLPPLEINFSEKVKFYQITITTDEFILPAGKEQTDNYMIKLVPTTSILDSDLGGTVVKGIVDSNNNIIGYEQIDGIYGGGTNKFYISSLKERYNINYYDNPNFTGNKIKSIENLETVTTGTVNLYKDGTLSKSVDSKNSETIKNEETFNTSKVTETLINDWSEFSVKSNEVTIDNYQNNYVALGVKENDLNKVYYIHKIEVERTMNSNISLISNEYKITPIDNVVKQIESQENTKIVRIDGENETILQNIVKSTTTSYDGNFNYSLTTTTKEYKRTYNQEGYIYRAYYLDDDNNLAYLDSDDIKLLEIIVDNGNNLLTNNDYYPERIIVTNESSSDLLLNEDTNTTNKTNETNITMQNYEYYQKVINRIYDYKDVILDKVIWSEFNEDDVLESFEINSENALDFYESDIQKIWLAQCYSKNYPFYVDVIFEQTR